MKLPNADQARVDIQKLEGYCLNPHHPRGKHKAKVFKQVLGFAQEDAWELEMLIREAILENECTEGRSDQYGQRFTVDFACTRKNQVATIRTTWIIKTSEWFPRLTTCFVI